jgi:acetyl/propionyl-CoA carboxylase alpha subunit
MKLARSPDQLDTAFRRAQAEAQIIYGDKRVYVERLIEPSHLIAVQIVGDALGNLIHVGEREGSLQRGNQKFIEESPAPCLFQAQREQVWQQALEIADLFHYRSVGTVEFIVDGSGQFYFTEIKPRIQIEHLVTEMVSSIDLVREQLRVAAGEPLSITQSGVELRGHAIACRITAEDPLNDFLPAPGQVRRVRLPGGPHVRVDTYMYSGCDVPAEYDPIIAKVCAWGIDRDDCVLRMRRALEDLALIGTATNLPAHLRLLSNPDFVNGDYTTNFFQQWSLDQPPDDALLRDLAIAAAIAYVRRNLAFRPSLPDRLQSGWHRSSRQV